jgi:hypothetical protein
MASKNNDITVATASLAPDMDELLSTEEVGQQEGSEVFQSHSTQDDIHDEEEIEWKEILPPPPVTTLTDDPDEKYEVIPTKLTTPETSTTVATTGGTTTIVHHTLKEEQRQAIPEFSQYKTNVARRLWEAQQTAGNAGQKSSPDLVPLKREFQQYRKKMRTLIRFIDEYQEAMQILKDKRTQVSGSRDV